MTVEGGREKVEAKGDEMEVEVVEAEEGAGMVVDSIKMDKDEVLVVVDYIKGERREWTKKLFNKPCRSFSTQN